MFVLSIDRRVICSLGQQTIKKYDAVVLFSSLPLFLSNLFSLPVDLNSRSKDNDLFCADVISAITGMPYS